MICHYILPSVVSFNLITISDILTIVHLSSASPREVPRADVGEYGDFMGTFSTNLSPCGGEMICRQSGQIQNSLRIFEDEKKLKYSTECLLSEALQLQVKSIVFRNGI